MRNIFYFLPLILSFNAFAEYLKKDTSNNAIEINFLNNVLDSRIREIKISVDLVSEPLCMTITFDGPNQRENAEKLAEIFQSRGVDLDSAQHSIITTTTHTTIPTTEFSLRRIGGDQIDIYRKALDVIHEFEAVEPAGMLDNIKADMYRLFSTALEYFHEQNIKRTKIQLPFPMTYSFHSHLNKPTPVLFPSIR